MLRLASLDHNREFLLVILEWLCTVYMFYDFVLDFGELAYINLSARFRVLDTRSRACIWS